MQAAPIEVQIRVLDEYAIVPSSTGRGCYHVQIENDIAAACSCPDHQRRARACKHMVAVDEVLRGEGRQVKGRDAYHATLTPRTTKKKLEKAREAQDKGAGVEMAPDDPRWFYW